MTKVRKNNEIGFIDLQKTSIIFKSKRSSTVSNKRLKSIAKYVSSNMKLEGQDIGEKETLKLAKSVIEGMGYSVEK